MFVSYVTRREFFMKKLFIIFFSYLPVSYFFNNWSNLNSVFFFYFTYVLLWLTYVLVLVCSQNSVTLQMMSFIGFESRTKNEVLHSVPEGQDILVRVEKMIKNGWLSKDKDGNLLLTAKGKAIARLTIFLRKKLT